MRYSSIFVLQLIFVGNMLSLEIDTVRLQLVNSVCYADNIIEELDENSNGVIVYPNPSYGMINIAFDDFDAYKSIDLNIYNIQGGIIYSSTIKLHFNVYTLNLSFLKPGIYFISVRQKDNVVVNKLVRY